MLEKSGIVYRVTLRPTRDQKLGLVQEVIDSSPVRDDWPSVNANQTKRPAFAGAPVQNASN